LNHGIEKLDLGLRETGASRAVVGLRWGAWQFFD
jgi:hypothetical protein